MGLAIEGLHHITLVCANAQRTVDFYTRVLGQRLVKKTVNFDDPCSYHLYFGDRTGRPGSAITFFEWPNAPQGHPGIGGTHHFALAVSDYVGLLQWKRRLTDLGLKVQGPYDRHYFISIYFNDPDGTILEIATRGPGWAVDEARDELGMAYQSPLSEQVIGKRDERSIDALTWPEPVGEISTGMALSHGMHHITAISSDIEQTHLFYTELLNLRRVKMTDNFDDPGSAHWYWGVGEGAPGTLITYFDRKPGKERRVKLGAGQTHHFALAVPDEQTQLDWRDRLLKAGWPVSPVMDRVYFKSIYSRDPDGHIVELATAGPGFAVDESQDGLGQRLMLPPWLERRRTEIEATLQPISIAPWQAVEHISA